MYICICNQITDHQIRDAVSCGATRMRDLQRDLGVASQCGKCCQAAKSVLEQAVFDCNSGCHLQAA